MHPTRTMISERNRKNSKKKKLFAFLFYADPYYDPSPVPIEKNPIQCKKNNTAQSDYFTGVTGIGIELYGRGT